MKLTKVDYMKYIYILSLYMYRSIHPHIYIYVYTHIFIIHSCILDLVHISEYLDKGIKFLNK